jgi:Zn-dependent alcohol dehydrogenase
MTGAAAWSREVAIEAGRGDGSPRRPPTSVLPTKELSQTAVYAQQASATLRCRTWIRWARKMGSTRLSVDVPRLVDLYRQGRLKLDELVTARYPLDRIDEAVERGEALRNVIVFD